MIKPFYVADDWGLSREINDGILELIRRNVIGRVSAMTNGAFFDYRLDELKDLKIETSLHFDLTWKSELPLKHFFTNAGRLKGQVFAELDRQIEKYQSSGFTLSAIESHQYVHCIPPVALLVLAYIEEELNGGLSIGLRRPLDVRHLVAKAGALASFRWYYSGCALVYPIDTYEFRERQDPARQMVIHPAAAISDDARDAWRVRRYREHQRLLNFTDALVKPRDPDPSP